jgi:hypothetical protein
MEFLTIAYQPHSEVSGKQCGPVRATQMASAEPGVVASHQPRSDLVLVTAAPASNMLLPHSLSYTCATCIGFASSRTAVGSCNDPPPPDGPVYVRPQGAPWCSRSYSLCCHSTAGHSSSQLTISSPRSRIASRTSAGLTRKNSRRRFTRFIRQYENF